MELPRRMGAEEARPASSRPGFKPAFATLTEGGVFLLSGARVSFLWKRHLAQSMGAELGFAHQSLCVLLKSRL